MVHVISFPIINIINFYIRTFRRAVKCAGTVCIAVLFSVVLGNGFSKHYSGYFLNDFEMVPVAPFIVTLHKYYYNYYLL